jgi:membrane-associated phospholipid phosphatase
MRPLIILALLLFSFGVNAPAQGTDSTLSTLPGKKYFKSYLTDSRDILISPVRWNAYQWIGVTAVVGTTVFLFTQDAAIQKVFQANQTPFMTTFSRYFIEPWGSGLYTLPALGILYGCGAILKNNKAKAVALKGAEAFILAAVSAQIVKQLTHRHRPGQDDPPDPGLWEGPIAPVTYTSFPSGHSAVVFAVATVLGSAYSETVWVPILCYSIACMTAISRIYDNKHWASDVLVGSALGFAIGKTVYRNGFGKVKLLPVSPTGLGVTLLYPL